MANAAPPSYRLSGDTIAAVATPAGAGGVGIVRVSGPAARSIAAQVCGDLPEPRQAGFRRFGAGGDFIDEGLVLVFPTPGSFTGEDVVELQGHGGPIVMELLLQTVLEAGARLALPGEFSERAFVNGKLDLAQAEAIADLISAASVGAARGAARALTGEFSRRVTGIGDRLVELRVLVEATVDFPEEEIDVIADHDVASRLGAITSQIDALLVDCQQGQLLAEGVNVVLSGPPNVGKSSLLNALIGQDRAIVTDIPGTTRDVIEADLVIDGMPVRLVDTAGLRESDDPVEMAGIERARSRRATADLVLDIVDAREVSEVSVADPRPETGSATVLVVANKSDLVSGELPDVLAVSAVTGDGLSALRDQIGLLVGKQPGDGVFTARSRHIDALRRALDALQRAQGLIDNREGIELIAEELRFGHEALGTITGTMTADDLLGEIFRSFCIGK